MGRVGPPIQSAGCRQPFGTKPSGFATLLAPGHTAGVTYFVLAPDYAATVTSQPGLPTATSLPVGLSRLLLPRAWSSALSYVTTQVHCPMRDTFLMYDASGQDHRDLVSLLYIHVRHEIEVGIPSTMHRE